MLRSYNEESTVKTPEVSNRLIVEANKCEHFFRSLCFQSL